jgi:hypothetical protein
MRNLDSGMTLPDARSVAIGPDVEAFSMDMGERTSCALMIYWARTCLTASVLAAEAALFIAEDTALFAPLGTLAKTVFTRSSCLSSISIMIPQPPE